MSLIVLSSILKTKKSLSVEVNTIYDFLSEQDVGDFETVERVENFTDIEAEIIESVLKLFEKNGLVKKTTRLECLDCQSDVELDSNRLWCDGCDKYKKIDHVYDREGYQIIEAFAKRKSHEGSEAMGELSAFQTAIVLGVANFILAIKRKNPPWLVDILSGKRTPREDYYRDAVELSFKTAFHSNGEINHTGGRSDLIVNPNDNSDGVVGEFKIWGANDYLSVCDQLLGYMDNFESVGFVFMVNDNKSEVWKRYVEEVIESKESYIKNSLAENPISSMPSSFKHYSSKHKLGDRIVTLFHFVFDQWIK